MQGEGEAKGFERIGGWWCAFFCKKVIQITRSINTIFDFLKILIPPLVRSTNFIRIKYEIFFRKTTTLNKRKLLFVRH